jgi:hypothetical protein
MDDTYIGQFKDVILGQDFLTWLWFKSETRRGEFTDENGQAFELYMEQKISVQGGEGEAVETTQVSGLLSELREAKMGLAMGKKVTKATLRIEQDPDAWQVAVSSQDFTVSGLKTPKVETRKEEGEDPDAAFLEKMYLIERCMGFLDAAYVEFLQLRLGPGWDKERAALRSWLGGE